MNKNIIERVSKAGFEICTCGRCGGSGRYSYCQMYGDRCFKCGGSGVVYTGRGLMAKLYFERLLSRPVEAVKVGDLVEYDNALQGRRYFVKVEAIRGDPLNPQANYTVLECSSEKFGSHALHHLPGALVRVGHDAEQKRAALAKAVAFMAKLGVKGKAAARGQKLSDEEKAFLSERK